MQTSDWILLENTYYVKTVVGGDPKNVADRLAVAVPGLAHFMVRVRPFDLEAPGFDVKNWRSSRAKQSKTTLAEADTALKAIGYRNESD